LTSLLIDPRFQGAETRLANRDELDEVLGNYLQKKPSSYWMDLLIKNSIPCSVIENIESISNNLISEEYKAFSEIEVGTTKQKMRFVRNPISSENLVETPPPKLGEHTLQILQEIGCDESLIQKVTN
jgi:crotonobetainyl-CoA:carnitine CoA-transferase CaiB-like acyl-CoA transferase